MNLQFQDLGCVQLFKWFTALCLELDLASQGRTVEEARRNPQEAVELFVETASPEVISQRLVGEISFLRRAGLPRPVHCLASAAARS